MECLLCRFVLRFQLADLCKAFMRLLVYRKHFIFYYKFIKNYCRNILSKVSHTKSKYMNLFVWILRTAKKKAVIGKEIRIVVASKLRLWGRGVKEQGLTEAWHEGTLWDEENVLYLNRSIGYISMHLWQCIKRYTQDTYIALHVTYTSVWFILLSESSQIWKTSSCMIPLYGISEKAKL